MPDFLTVRDERTGVEYKIPIIDGLAISATDLRKIKLIDDASGLVSFDPGLVNTATCHSKVTYIDGDKGILRYRGYPIEQLARESTYLETAYLIIKGELPNREHFIAWKENIRKHTIVNRGVEHFLSGFWHDAHPMVMLVSTVGALASFYPDANNIFDLESRRLQTRRLIGKLPTLAAYAYRHLRGFPYVMPNNKLGYTENFLTMMYKDTENEWMIENPTLINALDVLFILHADHEQNCSTNAMRAVASSQPDPYSAVAAACAALYGSLHGGANEAVLKMLNEIGSVSNIPATLEEFKKKGSKKRLMGFGHRVYKNFDPRATIIKRWTHRVLGEVRLDPLLDIALELERIALEDDYFVERKLYPNVDFYSGLIYKAMGFPVQMFPVLFAIARVSGWLAHWAEMVTDTEQKIVRPQQIYIGSEKRDYIGMSSRPEPSMREDSVRGDI